MRPDVDKIYKYMSFKSAVLFFDSQHIRMTQPTSLNDIFENPIEADNVWTQFGNSMEDISITSYTETPTNLLMWAHYADEYKGVVIGFDTRHEFFENLRRVRYHEHQGTGKNQPEDLILLKGNDWIYEKEWRQIWNTTSEDRNNRKMIDGEIDHLPNYGGFDKKDDNQDEYSNGIYEMPLMYPLNVNLCPTRPVATGRVGKVFAVCPLWFDHVI